MRKPIFLSIFVLTAALVASACYRPPPVTRLRNASTISQRTLFLALDGIDYDLVRELHEEGYFRDFLPPVPFVSTFPSDTTVGFTGIMQPLDVGRVPGYEVRFYSYKQNKVVGGTPFDIYKIPINYKHYFDSFRHQIHQKAIMYVFPGLAGKEDLVNTETALMHSDKRVVMTYLGGTDGSQHLLGRARTKRFLKYVDWYLKRLVKRYEAAKHEKLRIVLFSDHGFYHSRLKTITESSLLKELKPKGFKFAHEITSDRDIVDVTFGLLSAGVLFTPLKHRDVIARTVADVEGIDLVFWHRNSNKEILIHAHDGREAKFEFRDDGRSYRYVPINGDPLGYAQILADAGHKTDDWLSDATWKPLTANASYPDAGYRLYEAFFKLVKNPANILFSTEKPYQFGSMAARVGTWLKFGHKGTHGGLFKEASLGIMMANTPPPNTDMPASLRYDELFQLFLPQVTAAYEKGARTDREVSVVLSPEQFLEMTDHTAE